MADLSVMGFLNEETQQETEYNLKDAQARNDISTINSKIPSNASSSNKLATISDVSAAYKPKGNATLATLPSLTVEHLNWVYNMTEDFITTSDFAEGAGKLVEAGNEVGIIDVSATSTPSYKYTVLGGFVDTSSLQPKELDTPVEVGGVNRTTVEGALLALQNNKEDNMLLAEPLYQEYDDIMHQAVTRIRMDDAPTANSNNTIKSGGVKSALDTKVGWVDAENYVGYNIFNKDATPNNVQGAVQAIPTATGVNVKSTASGAWAIARYWIKVKSNTTYKITTNVTVASGESTIYIQGSTLDNPTAYGDFTESLLDECNTGAISRTFSTGSCKWIQVGLFATRNTAGSLSGNVTYSDLMVIDNALSSLNLPFENHVLSNTELDEVKADKTDVVLVMNDTVGWVGGNKIPFPYTEMFKEGYGITFTAYDDGTVKINGTATGSNVVFGLYGESTIINGYPNFLGTKPFVVSKNIKMNKSGSGIYIWCYDASNTLLRTLSLSQNELNKVLTLESDVVKILIGIRIVEGDSYDNVILEPMICTPEQFEFDPSYRRNHKSMEEEIQDIYDFNAKTGVHQLLTYPYVDTTKTVTDITFTDIGDGSIKINGNNSTSSSAIFRLFQRDSSSGSPQLILPAGKYKLCKDITTSGITMTVAYTSSGSGVILATLTDSSKEVEFTVTDSMGKLTVQVNAGSGSYSDVIIKPLLKLAEDKSNLVTSYAMTNRELTEKVQETNSSVSLLDSPAEVGNTGMITFPISDIMQYSDIVVVGYNDSDSGGNRFVAVIPTEIDGQFDVGIPFVVKSSTGVGFIVARIASNALSLTFLDNANTNITTMYVKKIYGRKR